MNSSRRTPHLAALATGAALALGTAAISVPAASAQTPPPADTVAPALGLVQATPGTTTRPKKGEKRRFRFVLSLDEHSLVVANLERFRDGEYRRLIGMADWEQDAGLDAHKVAIGPKLLRPGSYRWVLTAVDPSGNESAPVYANFKIKKPGARP